MKKLTILAIMIIPIIMASCNSSSTKEDTNTEESKNENVSSVLVLDNQDAMMAKLAEYEITIPEEMVFRSVDKQIYLTEDFEEDETYVISFDILDPEKINREELLQWFLEQRETLKNNGWTEESFEKEVEKIGGGLSNRTILKKNSENCTLDISLSYHDEGSTIIIHPLYEEK